MSIRPDVLLFDFTRDISKENQLKGIKPYRGGIDYLRKHNIHGSACCYLFRRSLLGDLRFQPGILHEDELFTPQLLLKAELLIVADASPYYYRKRTDTITHQPDPEHVQRRRRDSLFVIKELDVLAKRRQGKEEEALRRRVSQLSMDYIYNGWQSAHSFGELLSCLRTLKECGLYPLPLKFYTLKYWFFALMVNSLCVFL